MEEREIFQQSIRKTKRKLGAADAAMEEALLGDATMLGSNKA